MGCDYWSMILDVYFWWWSPLFSIDLSSDLMIEIWTYDLINWLNLIRYLSCVPSNAWNHYSYDVDLPYFLNEFLLDFSYFLPIFFPYFSLYSFPFCMYGMTFDVWQVHEVLWRGIRKFQIKEFWKVWNKRLASLLRFGYFGTSCDMRKELKDNLMVIGEVNGCLSDGYVCFLYWWWSVLGARNDAYSYMIVCS